MPTHGELKGPLLVSGTRPASPESEPEPEPEALPGTPPQQTRVAGGRVSYEPQLEELDDDASQVQPDGGGEFAQLYRDETLYLKDGCTTCPPTCAATKTFAWQLTRAVLPFVLLGQLSLRWCRRKLWMSEEQLESTRKDTFITVRLLAECAGRMFHMVLVYVVLCNSALTHRWLKATFGEGVGTKQGPLLELLAGQDPAERGLNDTQQHHTYVDVALSETFYPLWVYLLLAVLCAHEETSYPRRTRVEYSVETDSLLLRGVNLMKQLGAPKDRRVMPMGLDKFGYTDRGRGKFGDVVSFEDEDDNLRIANERGKDNGRNPAGIIEDVTDPRNDKRKFSVVIDDQGTMTLKCTDRNQSREVCGQHLWTKGVEQNNSVLFVAVSAFYLGVHTCVFYWLEYAGISPVKILRTADKHWLLALVCVCVLVGCCSFYWAERGHDFYLGINQSLQGTALKAHNGLLGLSSLCFLLAIEALAFCFDFITAAWDYWLTELGLVVPIGSICMILVGVLLVFVSLKSGGSEEFAADVTRQYGAATNDLLKEQITQAEGQTYSDRYTRRFRELQCTPIENYHLVKWEPYQKRGRVDIRGVNPRLSDMETAAEDQRGTQPQPQFYQEFERVLIHGKKDGIRTPDKEPIVRSIEKLRKQMPNGEKPLTADLVAKMILRLSKARQLKRRLQWRGGGLTGKVFSPLYLISIGHASIPFVFTFVTTLPEVTAAAAMLSVCALLIGSCMKEEIRMHSAKEKVIQEQLEQHKLHNSIAQTKEDAKLEHAKGELEELEQTKGPQSPLVKHKSAEVDKSKDLMNRKRKQVENKKDRLETEKEYHLKWRKRCEHGVLGWKVFCSLLFLAWLGTGFFSPTDEFLPEDTCGDILDTQGQCCFRNSTLDVATKLALLDTNKDALCCPSYFNPRGPDSWDLSLVVPKAVFSNAVGCKPCEFSQNLASLQGKRNSTAPSVEKNMHLHIESVCFGQDWLDARSEPQSSNANLFPVESGLYQPAMTTIGGWCQAFNDSNADVRSDYLVAPLSYEDPSKRLSACVAGFNDVFATRLGFGYQGCLACGGSVWIHLLHCFVTASLTFAVASRLYRCYEDYVLQHHRMMYFLHLTPWSTMQQKRKDQKYGDLQRTHEHWGLLPTFDLDSSANIAAWNKIRIFLQNYDTRASRRLQVSVVYLLVAWLAMCVYQGVKIYQRRNESIRDIETVFVYSSTALLTAGLVAILQIGKARNEVTYVGVTHVLALKQADLLEKSAHFLVEHDHFNGDHLHSKRAGQWQCACTHCSSQPGGAYDVADEKLRSLVDHHAQATGHLSLQQEIGEEDDSGTLERQSTKTDMEEWLEMRRKQDLDPSLLRSHCYNLLRTLERTVHNEHIMGSRSHWGGEDRRTKLWFIPMTRSTLNGFIAALISGISPILFHAVDRALNPNGGAQ